MVTPLPADRILLTGLRVHAHHGVFAEERRDGQPFVIDLEVALDLAPAGGTDELGRTLHYGELAEEVAAAVGRDPVDLIETLAERVAGVVPRIPWPGRCASPCTSRTRPSPSPSTTWPS